MTDIRTALNDLRRPRLLVRAARHGMSDYNRKRDLRRIAGQAHTNSPSRVMAHLVAQEEVMETTRRSGDAAYSIARHVEVLVALMHESRLIPHDQRRSA